MPKRVLIFFPHNPYPPRTGAHRAAPEYIGGFRKAGCEVMLASTTFTTDTPWNTESRQAIEREWGAKVSVFHGDWRETKFIGATGRLLEMQRREPAINSPVYSPPRMRRWFADLAREFKPDVVLMNYAQWDGLIHNNTFKGVTRTFKGVTRAIYTHDLVTHNKKLFAALNAALPPRPISVDEIDDSLLDEGYIESLRIHSDPAEFAIYDSYDYTIAVSAREEEEITNNVSHTHVLRISPTYQAADLVNTYDGPAVFASGAHALNVIGYAYFVRRVLPDVLQQVPEFSLDVTGVLDRQVAGPSTKGVSFTGFAPSLDQIYKNAAFSVVPVFRGTGVAVKVIEAMAHGVAPIALAQTVEPDLVRHGENGLVARDAAEFAQHVVTLWRDHGLRRRLGEQARLDARRYSRDQMAMGVQTILSGKT